MNFSSASYIKNQRGVGMVEIMIALAISTFILTAAMITFYQQDDIFKDEVAKNNVRSLARFNFNRFIKELHMVGYGLTSDVAITSATATGITYRANTDDTTTSITNALAANATSLILSSATGFDDNQSVIVRDLDNGNFDLDTVSDVTANIMTLNTGVTVAYPTTDAVVVSRYRTIAFAFNNGAHQITRSIDGATATQFMQNVGNVTFAYRDGDGTAIATPVSNANLPNIREIDVTILFQDSDDTSINISLETEVRVRNMG